MRQMVPMKELWRLSLVSYRGGGASKGNGGFRVGSYGITKPSITSRFWLVFFTIHAELSSTMMM